MKSPFASLVKKLVNEFAGLMYRHPGPGRPLLLIALTVMIHQVPTVKAQVPEGEISAPEVQVMNLNADFREKENLTLIIQGKAFHFSGPLQLPDDLQGHYQKLPEDLKIKFLENRVLFLTKMSQILSTAFWGRTLGTSSLVGNKIRWYWNRLNENLPSHSPTEQALKLMKHPRGSGPLGSDEKEVRDLILQQEEARDAELSRRAGLTLQENRQLLIESILRNLDKALWSRPGLVADSNEIGVFGSLGVTSFLGAEVGKVHKGFGGSLDLGIFFGWNKSQSAAVVQIFQITEKFRGTMTAITGNLAIVPKWGFMFSNTIPGKEMRGETGRVMYPLTPPGMSSYYLSSPQRFAVGMNPPIGVIPWPLDSILVYSMDYVMRPLLRLRLRFEVLNQFIQIETTDTGEVKRVIKSKVLRGITWMSGKISGRPLCAALHNSMNHSEAAPSP